MTTSTADRAEVFSRPAAQINDDGELVVRASSALGCRRALWYSATGYQPTNPPSDESLTAMEAGQTPLSRWLRGRWRGRAGGLRPPTPGTRRL